MFGVQKNPKHSKLNEDSSFNPNSPYAKGKLKIHKKINVLRKDYEWPIVSGIMFNHESEFRKDEYLIKKIYNSVKN